MSSSAVGDTLSAPAGKHTVRDFTWPGLTVGEVRLDASNELSRSAIEDT